MWQQLIHQAAVKHHQQQQAGTGIPPTSLARVTTSSVIPAVPLNSQQQSSLGSQQFAVGQKQNVVSNLASRTLSAEQQLRHSLTISVSAASQLHNDFRNAEQMRKERDENAKQFEAQQKKVVTLFARLFLQFAVLSIAALTFGHFVNLVDVICEWFLISERRNSLFRATEEAYC